MHQLSTGIIFSTLLGLSGCANWPPEGHGGMAENYQGSLHPVIPGQPLGPEHGLRFDLDLARQHLDILVLEGAELCFPATVMQARQRQNHIIRELQGSLDFDAANNLIVQRTLLARLERQLDYVKQQDICILPTTNSQKRPGDTGKYIYGLLNSSNQFSTDLLGLNPRYVGQLAEAAQLLRHQPSYHLRIIGHTDSLDKPANNHETALARAKKVGRYLQIMGLPAERIQIDTTDSEHFLSMDTDKQINIKQLYRHVSIELIEVYPPTQTTRK